MSGPGKTSLHLLVEGADDLFAIGHLINERFKASRCKVDAQRDTSGCVHITQHGGIERLLARGVISHNAKTYERLGIIVDTDQPPAKNWDAVCNRLREVGVDLPAMPQAGGMVVTGFRATWKVGVWLMPDNGHPGALEEFLHPLMDPKDPLWTVADSSTTAAEQTDRRYGPNDGLKARLRCWLAWQAKPGAGVGPAIAGRVLDPHHASADPFVRWIEAVFA